MPRAKKPRPASRRTSAKQIAKLERDAECFRLRKAGKDYGEIAKEVGYSNRSGAYKAAMRVIEQVVKETHEDAREVVTLELARLDDLLVTCWEEAKEGNMGAVDRVLRIMERRERYLGLDAPKRTELTGADGGPVKLDLANMSLDELEAIARGSGNKSGG